MCAVGLAIGVGSLSGWSVLAGLALLPPLVIARLWKDNPTMSAMSESIHEALR
jgi:hypothetical protein